MECRVCASRAAHECFAVREMMYGTRQCFDYFQCADCGCLQIADMPADMAPYYGGSYYSYQPLAADGRVKRYLRGLRNGYTVSGRGLAGRLLPRPAAVPPPMRSLCRIAPRKDASILDVGCGAGVLLSQLREAGYRHLLGVDAFIDRDLDYGHGLRVRKQELQQVSGQWDLIMFHHSFEHLRDPVGTLRAVRRRLKPGGHCILRVPTVSSYAWEHYGTDWVQLDAPRHFYLHSVRSIEVLCAVTGLALTDVVYDSGPLQFWGSEQYRRDIPLHDDELSVLTAGPGLFSDADMADYHARAEALNEALRGDQAVFYLRKADAAQRASAASMPERKPHGVAAARH